MTEEWVGGETLATFEGRAPNVPPANELPALLLARQPLIWRSADAAIAVLALEVYTTGAEFTITGRIRNQSLARQLNDDPRFLQRAISGQDDDGLRFRVLAADERVPLISRSTRYDGRIFLCRAWASATDDLTFSLEWPLAGIGYAEYEVEGVREASGQAVRLWGASSAAG